MQKLDKTLKAHSINFDESKCVFNVFTKKVLNPKLAEEFLAYETIGIELLEIFIKERFEGEKLIWDPIMKRKLPTFRSSQIACTVITLHTMCTQMGFCVIENLCTVLLIPLCKNNLNLPISHTDHYALRKKNNHYHSVFNFYHSSLES